MIGVSVVIVGRDIQNPFLREERERERERESRYGYDRVDIPSDNREESRVYLGFSRFHVTDDKSLLVNRTGGVPDASRPKTVQLLPFPVTPGLLDDIQRHVRFQRAVVLLRRKAAHCLETGGGGGSLRFHDRDRYRDPTYLDTDNEFPADYVVAGWQVLQAHRQLGRKLLCPLVVPLPLLPARPYQILQFHFVDG